MKSHAVQLVVIAALSIALLALVSAGFGKSSGAPDRAAEQRRQWLAGEGAFFVRKDCIACHSIRAFGISAAKFGPDLSEAAVDTERRFGKSLEEFLHHPSGTMSIVLGTRTPLAEAEKQEAIRLLKIAYQRKLEPQSQLKQ
ncbi:MAG: hypothetical protein JST85_11925 [Acidobacteria bacterium]|nr:hypothetical protein [Acidobacteriota bacterium]